MIVPIKIKNINVLIELDPIVEEIVVTKELKCLADNIYHEAKGESIKGKLGVAQVTLNRVKAPGFPANVCDVVYEKSKKKVKKKTVSFCQYEWVCRKGMKIDNLKVYEDSVLIAHAALNGVELKELKGSLYFHASYVKPNWRMRPVAKIGNHIFY